MIVIAFGLMTGCATKEKLTGSSLVPAAQGIVKADKAKGGNTDLEVKVEHLAPAERVRSGAKDYIVWI
jgi:hypothetical protein